jgi:hypothetical protein
MICKDRGCIKSLKLPRLTARNDEKLTFDTSSSPHHLLYYGRECK